MKIYTGVDCDCVDARRADCLEGGWGVAGGGGSSLVWDQDFCGGCLCVFARGTRWV